MNVDMEDAWDSFCNDDTKEPCTYKESETSSTSNPKCSNLYISTKTKISYLNTPILLSDTFWKLKMVPYHVPITGIIKKQMKFISLSEKELSETVNNLNDEDYNEQHIIQRIVKEEGRIQYRDVRKISVGLCKKDITSYRSKKKGAFYNCFALIIRIHHDGTYKEIHVKVFNTGKLEIPGIQTDDILDKTLTILCESLNNAIQNKDIPITWDTSKNETVLINSNFSCGYFINRDKLYQRLKYHYRINCEYDPCSYPGIQCDFYYTLDNIDQHGQQPIQENTLIPYTKMSFMIFRTGSILIVGKCNENMLTKIYTYLKHLLENEYHMVGGKLVECKSISDNKNSRKLRKKTITIQTNTSIL